MKDFNTYKLNLSNAMKEKTFFLNKIDITEYDLIVDFGCGPGELLSIIARKLPQPNYIKLLGFDINQDMLREGRNLTKGLDITFTNKMSDIHSYLINKKKTLIIFSSVLHEIDEKNQKQIIGNIMTKFNTVVIRDMHHPLTNEPIEKRTRKRILAQVAPWQAEMFESRWGKIKDKKVLYRFFLMNEFVENFETEVDEDYFGVLWDEVSWYLDEKYLPIYEQNYTLPYRKEQVKKRFNYVMHDITHRKVIYMKNGK